MLKKCILYMLPEIFEGRGQMLPSPLDEFSPFPTNFMQSLSINHLASMSHTIQHKKPPLYCFPTKRWQTQKKGKALFWASLGIGREYIMGHCPAAITLDRL